MKLYKGSSVFGDWYSFDMRILNNDRCLGLCDEDGAEAMAQLYDAMQLIVHGHWAVTSYEWNRYGPGQFEVARQYFHSIGVDVQLAVVAARQAGPSEFTDFLAIHRAADGSWGSWAPCAMEGCAKAAIFLGHLPSAVQAAKIADCAILAMNGLESATNFGPSCYDRKQLLEGAEAVIAVGVDRAKVMRNLDTIEEVRLWYHYDDACLAVPLPPRTDE
jgi:hypothetical protein